MTTTPDVIVAHAPDLESTGAFAAALAGCLRAGDVLCLDGDLGAGKTAFVAALARALGGGGDVVSPTFTLENRYALEPEREDAPRRLVHYDLYRPGDDARRDLLGAMLEAIDEGALVAIEWPDAVRDWLSPRLDLRIELEAGPEAVRRLELRPVPGDWPQRERLRAAWEGSTP